MRLPAIEIGTRFGRWTVTSVASRAPNGRVRMHCRCDCGVERDVLVANLRRGQSTSCGCFNEEAVASASRTHGKYKSKEYRAWCGLRQRCTNSTHSDFADYGGRGITVCERWMNSFEAFLEDMGPRPSPRHSIDRVDNDRGYQESNCRWATPKEQANNRRTRGRQAIQ